MQWCSSDATLKINIQWEVKRWGVGIGGRVVAALNCPKFKPNSINIEHVFIRKRIVFGWL
jgi:hypothetical protein